MNVDQISQKIHSAGHLFICFVTDGHEGNGGIHRKEDFREIFPSFSISHAEKSSAFLLSA